MSDATLESCFLANIATIRAQKGISQQAIADDMAARGFGWFQSTVWKSERGTRHIRLDEAFAVAEILGTTVQAMAGDTDDGEQRSAAVIARERDRVARAVESLAMDIRSGRV